MILVLALQPLPGFAASSQNLDDSVNKVRDAMVARQTGVQVYF